MNTDTSGTGHESYNVIVVGGGVAGLSAAVFTARHGIDDERVEAVASGERRRRETGDAATDDDHVRWNGGAHGLDVAVDDVRDALAVE